MTETSEDSKGGGFRGGPRRWTGSGPRPARHIPWPELFKHHQSVLTGHLKMMDMVRKHCVEGTGNHATAKACVDRTHEMLRMFKKATATFVPPRDNIERVPLGASSASMYPGYSPADHVYGEAASEFGTQMAELRKKGVEIPSDLNGPEYNVASDRKIAKQQIEEIKRQREEEKRLKVLDDLGESNSQGNAEATNAERMEGVEETGNASELFMFDSNPTPVTQLQTTTSTLSVKTRNKANDKAKRRNSNQADRVNASAEPATSEKHKKKKAKTADFSREASQLSSDEFEKEAEAHHKEKEERRKSKKEKKRKRESDISLQLEVPASSEIVDVPIEESCTKKPKKKKQKKERMMEEVQIGASKAGTEEKEGEKEKDKERKKKRAIVLHNDVEELVEAGAKKRKKEKHAG